MIGSLVGSYKITDKIGEGGMGAVFRGIDIMLEREVAIKMLRPELSSQPNIVERFRSEAVTLARLNHPNIATLYSFVRQGDDFFMVMEFVRGETLDAVIRKSGAMACDRAIALLCQALEGIDHAHKMGIIHRDVKPANMMLTESGTLKVMDFGIARVLGTARMTKQGNIVGTIEYMSPEQVRGQETDARSDIYSLGILLYEMLTGRVPFSSDSEYDLMKMQIEDAPPPPHVFSAGIPHSIEQAIMRSLAKRPEARFQTAAEFHEVLLAAVGAAAAPSVAAQSTRPVEPRVTQAPAPKETRLAPQAPATAPMDYVKQTRLAGDSSVPAAYQGVQAPGPIARASNSTAKVLVGFGAVVVVAAIIVSIALLSGRETANVAPTTESAQPPQTTAPSTLPSSAPNQAGTPAQMPPQVIQQPEPVRPVKVPANSWGADNTNAASAAKPTRKESDAEVAARKEKARRAAEARKLLSQ